MYCICVESRCHIHVYLTVEEPENIRVQRYAYYSDEVLEDLAVEKGENQYVITATSNERFVVSAVEGKVLKVHEADGSINYDVTNNVLSIALSSFSWSFSKTEYTLTIKTFDEATFRNRSVKVTLDKPDGILMTLTGAEEIKTDRTEYIIPYNEEYETKLEIRPVNAEDLIYRVTADGVEVAKSGIRYNITLVDRSDADDIKYVENIVINQEFPEDMSYTVKLAFANGDPGCIKEVSYNGENVENFADPDGFSVRPGKKLMILFNRDDYKILSYTLNDGNEQQATYLPSIENTVLSDLSYNIKADRYNYMDASFVVADPSLVKITKYVYPYPEIELTGTVTPVKFKDDGEDCKFEVSLRDANNYEITRIYDKTYDKETPVGSYGITPVELKENSEVEITVEPVILDKSAVIYIQ